MKGAILFPSLAVPFSFPLPVTFFWNWRSALLVVAAGQALAMTALLVYRSGTRRRWDDAFLATLLLLLTGELIPDILGFGGLYDAWPNLSFFPFETTFATGPLILGYLAARTNPRFRLRWSHGLHALPVFFEKGYYSWAWLHDLDWKDQFVATIHDPFIVPAERLTGTLVLLAYLLAAYRRYRAYRRWVGDEQSDAGLQIEWLGRFLGVIGGLTALSTVFAGASFFTPLGYDQWFVLHGLNGVAIWWLSLMGYLAPAPADAPAPPVRPGPPEPVASDPDEVARWKPRLESLLAHDPLWLNPRLSVQEVAQRLGTNTGVVSRVVNAGYGSNFNDFINGYRIRAVQARLAAGEATTRTLLAVALDCGFSTKSTFNRAFRKATGHTPREELARLPHLTPASLRRES
jgi:AraC-like DNA-binding protein